MEEKEIGQQLICTQPFLVRYSSTPLPKAISSQHCHDTYEIDFFIQADLQIFLKDRRYQVGDCQLLFVEEYGIHHMMYNPTENYSRYVVNFHRDCILPLLCALKLDFLLEDLEQRKQRVISLSVVQESRLRGLFDALLPLFHAYEALPSVENNAMMLTQFLQILLTIHGYFAQYQEENAMTSQQQLIQEVVRYLEQNYAEPIQLSQLEERFHTDKFYLSHLFKKVTGFSVVEYLQYRRVAEAQKLLTQTDQDIASIFLDCGFHNSQHFYRVFREIAKMSPKKYRDATRLLHRGHGEKKEEKKEGETPFRESSSNGDDSFYSICY